jgi:uncharacterized membrane protein YagU involved in acid resistance
VRGGSINRSKSLSNEEKLMPNSNDAAFTARSKSRPFPAIFVGGVIVGVLDIVYAILVYSPRKPIRVLQAVASGVLGPKSFTEGGRSAALGLLLHFVIALGAATVFYLASRRLPFLLQRPILSGLIYGGLVYAFMHLVVLPLSAVPHGPTRWIYQGFEFVEHWFFVGLPISLSARRYSR